MSDSNDKRNVKRWLPEGKTVDDYEWKLEVDGLYRRERIMMNTNRICELSKRNATCGHALWKETEEMCPDCKVRHEEIVRIVLKMEECLIIYANRFNDDGAYARDTLRCGQRKQEASDHE